MSTYHNDIELTHYTSRVSTPIEKKAPDGCLFSKQKLDELKERYRPLFAAYHDLQGVMVSADSSWFQLVTAPIALDADEIDPANPDSYCLYNWKKAGWLLSGLRIPRRGRAYLEFYEPDVDELLIYLS